MFVYDMLEIGFYYLIREFDDSPIILIKIVSETDTSFFVHQFNDTTEKIWKLKNDYIHEIIEQLEEKTAKEWEKVFKNEEDDHYNNNNRGDVTA